MTRMTPRPISLWVRARTLRLRMLHALLSDELDAARLAAMTLPAEQALPHVLAAARLQAQLRAAAHKLSALGVPPERHEAEVWEMGAAALAVVVVVGGALLAVFG